MLKVGEDVVDEDNLEGEFVPRIKLYLRSNNTS